MPFARRQRPYNRKHGYLVLLALLLCGASAVVWQPWQHNARMSLHTTAIALTAGQPVAMAVDAVTRRAFVTSGGYIYVLDLDTGDLVRTLHSGRAQEAPPVSTTPAALAVDQLAARVFVTNYDDGTVSMLDARSGRLLHTEGTDVAPVAVAIDEKTAHVFVATANDGLIDVFDAHTGAAVQGDGGRTTIAIDGYSVQGAMVIDPRTRHGFAGDQQGTMNMFQTQTGVFLSFARTGSAGFASAAVDGQAGRVFAVDGMSGNVSAFDTRTGALVASIPVTGFPSTVVTDPRTGRGFTSSTDTVSMFDAHRGLLVRTVAVGPHPLLAVDEPRTRVVVASDTQVSVLDARSGALLFTRSLAVAPQAIALDEQTGHVLLVSGRQTETRPDSWAWIPRGIRSWLPFLPLPKPVTYIIPSAVHIIDEPVRNAGG